MAGRCLQDGAWEPGGQGQKMWLGGVSGRYMVHPNLLRSALRGTGVDNTTPALACWEQSAPHSDTPRRRPAPRGMERVD